VLFVYVVVALMASVSGALAQVAATAPPGPYVIDLRGSAMGSPTDVRFFPAAPSGTPIPTRGFGAEIGGHFYPVQIAGSRLGLGIAVARTFATTSRLKTTSTVVAPQISLNFGTRRGWSYLSAGYGVATVRAATRDAADALERDTGPVPAINAGGGARWFLNDRLAIGFDIRLHAIDGTERLMAAAVGISLR
jgi:hypothetical protein